MWLLLDVGNTRLKWRWSDGQQLLEGGSVPVGSPEAREPLKDVFLSHSTAMRVIASNVAGADAAQTIEAVAAETLGIRVEFVCPTAGFKRLKNGYVMPGSLGADRWVAMIGALELARGPVCIVDCGTAVTLDWIHGDGTHAGGMIIPGYRLMKQCLVTGTHQIRHSKEQGMLTSDVPGKDTQECIAAGAVACVVGMVEHTIQKLGGAEDVTCLVSGGDGAAFAAHLTVPHRVVPDLTFHGLLAFGRG